MLNKITNSVLIVLLVCWTNLGYNQGIIKFDKYHTNDQVRQMLQELQKLAPGKIDIHKVATSPGGQSIDILEIGKNLEHVPAIFVGANFEGKTLLATEGALYLAKMLLDSTKYTQNIKWFILPLSNPDATKGYFSEAKWERTVNDSEVNNDVDEQTDEDGLEDLNNDGFITQMRVEDPEGTFIISDKDPRLMVKADPKKGERGKYKLYTEGVDNDQDGSYNEDGPGGINVGINFPHLFKASKEAGLWPGEAPEAYGIMNFIFNHPEICMVYTLGTTNFCLTPPRTDRKGGPNFENIKAPEWLCSELGLDPSRPYTYKELTEAVKEYNTSRKEFTISTDWLVQVLNLPAVINPFEEDSKFYTDFSEKYKEYLKNKGFSTSRLTSDPDKDGSFELWAYYHLGVPSFSMNLFTIEKPTEQKTEAGKIKEDQTEKKESTTPSAKENSDDKILLSYIDKVLNGDGFVNWQSFNHPTLGKVEIGGYKPFVTYLPPANQIDSLCRVQMPWLLQLSTKLPSIKILKEKITKVGTSIYRLEVFIENNGVLSYPIAIGEWNRQPGPIVISLEGNSLDLLEGQKRTTLERIRANEVKKIGWLIKANPDTELTLKMESIIFGNEVKRIKLED